MDRIGSSLSKEDCAGSIAMSHCKEDLPFGTPKDVTDFDLNDVTNVDKWLFLRRSVAITGWWTCCNCFIFKIRFLYYGIFCIFFYWRNHLNLLILSTVFFLKIKYTVLVMNIIFCLLKLAYNYNRMEIAFKAKACAEAMKKKGFVKIRIIQNSNHFL